jgi:hypothetical protein
MIPNWLGCSSTDDSRLRGALPKPDSCTAAKNAYSLRSDDRYGLKDARKATIEIHNTPFSAR